MKWPFKSVREYLVLDAGKSLSKLCHVTYEQKQLAIKQAALLPSQELTAAWLKQSGFAQLPCISIFNEPKLLINGFDLPAMPEVEYNEVLRWHLSSQVEGKIDDYIIRYSILPNVAVDAQHHIVTYTTPRLLVENHTHWLHELGLNPQRIEPAAVSLAGSSDYTNRGSDLVQLHLDLSPNKTLFVITRGEHLLCGRSLDALVQDPTYYNQWAIEVQNAMDSYSVTHPDWSIKEIILSGGGAENSQLIDYLKQNLGLPARAYHEVKDMESLTQFGPLSLFATVLGAARPELAA